MIQMIFFTILVGISYGLLFIATKKRSFNKPQPFVDIFLTLLRFSILVFIVLKILKNWPDNSIHLLILFVSSYLSTIALLIFKQKN